MKFLTEFMQAYMIEHDEPLAIQCTPDGRGGFEACLVHSNKPTEIVAFSIIPPMDTALKASGATVEEVIEELDAICKDASRRRG